MGEALGDQQGDHSVIQTGVGSTWRTQETCLLSQDSRQHEPRPPSLTHLLVWYGERRRLAS